MDAMTSSTARWPGSIRRRPRRRRRLGRQVRDLRAAFPDDAVQRHWRRYAAAIPMAVCRCHCSLLAGASKRRHYCAWRTPTSRRRRGVSAARRCSRFPAGAGGGQYRGDQRRPGPRQRRRRCRGRSGPPASTGRARKREAFGERSFFRCRKGTARSRGCRRVLLA